MGFVLLDLCFYVWCFVNRCLSFCPFSFGHCLVCPSSIYQFWLSLWYLKLFLYDEVCVLKKVGSFKLIMSKVALNDHIPHQNIDRKHNVRKWCVIWTPPMIMLTKKYNKKDIFNFQVNKSNDYKDKARTKNIIDVPISARYLARRSATQTSCQ